MFRTILFILALTFTVLAATLKEAYDSSLPGEGYDKLVELETGKLYTGGLSLGRYYNPFTFAFDTLEDKSVKIRGNGAMIDLKNSVIHIAYTDSILDIDSCVIIGGTLRYSGSPSGDGGYIIPHGRIENVTFYKPVDFGVRMEGAGENMYLSRNLISECLSTGGDFPQYDTFPAEMVRTGTSISFSIFDWYGFPGVYDNWSYNPAFPGEPLADFSML
jgi:hypothetical protein